MGNAFTTKAILIGILLCINGYIVITYDIVLCAKELTHWALWLTTAQVMISLKCSMDPTIDKKLGWLAAHHIIFSLIMPMNLLVTSVYWTCLREVALATFANTATKAFHSGVVHLLPLLCTLANFAVTDIVMKASHGLLLLPFAFAYGYANYLTTKMQGYPVYPFLDWKDSTSFAVFGGLCSATLLAFFALSYLTKLIKRGHSNESKKDL